jgi:hypothetical protein
MIAACTAGDAMDNTIAMAMSFRYGLASGQKRLKI